MSRAVMPTSFEGDFVLVARNNFTAGEMHSLRWRDLRRVTKAMSDYVFQVQDLRNNRLENVHGSRLKFYQEISLNADAIMS